MKNNNSSSSSRMAGVLKKIFCCGTKSFPTDLPEGHVRVYVGKDVTNPSKFEVEANYLNHPLFENLLELSVEEFGYSYDGALRIPCETELFRYLLDLLQSRNPLAHYMDLQDLISKFYNTNYTTHQSHEAS